jgi:dihydrofolate reductase
MGKLVLAYSMSLDGFIAGPDVGVDEPMGKDGERLHDWMFKSASDIDADMAREQSARPGAVVLGRRTFRSRYRTVGGHAVPGAVLRAHP